MRGYFDYLTSSWSLYRRNAKILLIYSLIVAVIPTAITILTRVLGITEKTNGIFILLSLALTIGSAVLTTFFTIGLYRTTANILNNQDILAFGSQIKIGLKRFWPFIITNIVLGIIIAAGFILLIIPGIIFSIWYFAASYITATEDIKPLLALDESKKVVTGRWWQVFGYFFVIGLVLGIIAAIILTPLYYLLTLGLSNLYAQDVLSLIFVFLFVPFQYLIIGQLYYDLKKTAA